MVFCTSLSLQYKIDNDSFTFFTKRQEIANSSCCRFTDFEKESIRDFLFYRGGTQYVFKGPSGFVLATEFPFHSVLFRCLRLRYYITIPFNSVRIPIFSSFWVYVIPFVSLVLSKTSQCFTGKKKKRHSLIILLKSIPLTYGLGVVCFKLIQ